MKRFLIISGVLLVVTFTFAFINKGDRTKRKVIFTENAPKPVGPYSQAMLIGNTLYVAGQIGLDPKTGKLDSAGIQGQTRQALQNIYSVLQAADMNMAHIVKTTVYLKNIRDFDLMNKEYATYFDAVGPPPRETVGVADLPKGAGIEISVIAIK